MTQDWRLNPARGVVGSRAATVVVARVRRTARRWSAPRRGGCAVGTGLGRARVDEVVGFESACGKVGRSKAGGTLI